MVSALFPGINYYSMTGFGQVMRDCVTPALKKLFPELEGAEGDAFDADELVEVEEFQPSEGYEWQDSSEWREEFEKRLAA